jgi:transposase-like protein
MPQKESRTKLTFVIRSHFPEANKSEIAREAGVSRDTLYTWRNLLEERADWIFLHGSLADRYAALSKVNGRLRNRVDELERTLTRNGIAIPSPRKDYETEFDTDRDEDES